MVNNNSLTVKKFKWVISVQHNGQLSMLDGQQEELSTQRLWTEWSGLSIAPVSAILTKFPTLSPGKDL